MDQLIISVPNMPEVTYDLVDDPITIGRAPSNTISIVHTSISAHHARLDRMKGGYKLTDLDSTNKTWINGKPIHELELTSSQSFRFGAIACVFKSDPIVISKNRELEETQHKQIVELNAKLAAHNTQLEMAIKDREAAQQSNQQLFSKLEVATKMAQQGESHALLLTAKLKETELQITTLNQNQEAAETKISESLKRIELIQADKDTIQAELFEAKKELTEIAKQGGSQSLVLAAKLKETELQIVQDREAAEAKISESLKQVELILIELAESKKQVKGLLGLNKDLSDRLERQEQQLSSYPKEQEKLQDARDRALGEIEELQSELETARNSNQQLYAQLGETNQKLEETVQKSEQDLALLSANFSEAKQQLETLADLNGELGRQLQQSYQEYENMNAEMLETTQNAAKENAVISSKLTDAIREMEAVRLENDSLILLNKELTQQIEAARQPLSSTPEKQQIPQWAGNRELQNPLKATVPEPNPVKAKLEESIQQKEPEKLIISDESLRLLLEPAPQTVAVMRNGLQYFLRHPSDSKVLQELGQKISDLVEQMAEIKSHPVYKISTGISALIHEFIKFPDQMNRNTLRTLGQGFDSLVSLVDPKILPETNRFSQPAVLVIDDDAEIGAQLVTALKEANVHASPCISAKSALDLLNKQKYDLVLLDIKMPEINGLELCPMIRRCSQNHKTPIVFVTGAATPEIRANSTLAGGNDLIAKPFDLAEIALKSLVWIYKGQLDAALKIRKVA